MKTLSIFLLHCFLLISVSCKTVTPEVADESSLELSAMVQGNVVKKVWIDKSLVVGIVMPNMDSLPELLNDNNLEPHVDRVIRIQLGSYPTSSINYSFYSRTDGESINTQYSQELQELRSAYGDHFGVGIYNEQGIIVGVLSNSITVDFERRTPISTIDSILSEPKPVRFFRWRDNTYYVEYEKGIGYELLNVAQSLLEYDNVESISHQINVINSHSVN